MSAAVSSQVAGAWSQLVTATAAGHELDAAAAGALAGALRVIDESRQSEYAVTWFLDTASAAVSGEIAPKFWGFFEGFPDVKGSKGAAAWASARVSSALAYLRGALDSQLQVARAFESAGAQLSKHYGVASKCRANFAAVVFGPVPLHFHEILYLCLSKEFANFARKSVSAADTAKDEEEEDDASSGDEDSGDDSMEGIEGNEHGSSNFRQLCASINHVGALSMAEEVLTEVLYDKIAHRIEKRCAKQWDTRVLEKDVESWARRSVWPLLSQLRSSVNSTQDGSAQDAAMRVEGEDEEQGSDLANPKASAPAGSLNQFGQWRARLELFMYETFTNLRISELFDIIIEFPESQPALLDLKDSLSKTHQYAHLVTELRAALQKRLLHAGANTSDILTQYISTIKALHELDPSGTTLGAISLPVQLYLRGRPDTVRSIVTGLTDDTGSDLFHELRKGSAAGAEGRGWRWRPRAVGQGDGEGGGEGAAADSDGEEEGDEEEGGTEAAMYWMPDALLPGPCLDVYRKGSVDIIGMLVDIYGSTDLFLNEYRMLLSDKLLALTSYHIDHEVSAPPHPIPFPPSYQLPPLPHPSSVPTSPPQCQPCICPPPRMTPRVSDQVHNVELLKIRFGEGSLHKCEVMLKDLGDSKRLDAFVHKESDKQSLQVN